MPRFNNMGLMFPVEDHRKPNIIRGGAVKPSKNSRLKQSIPSPSGNNNNRMLVFPNNEELNSNFEISSNSEEIDENQILITDDFQHLVKEENSCQSENQQLVQSIQTESGNYIMFLRDNEVLELHSSSGSAEVNGNNNNNGAEQYVEEEFEQDNGLYDEQVSQYDDDEITAAVQHIEQASSESELTAETEDDVDLHEFNGEIGQITQSIEASQEETIEDNNEYVVVQLDDGNSYLIPTSSLASAGVTVRSEHNQVFVDENGDQFLQVDSGTEFSEVNYESTTCPPVPVSTPMPTITTSSFSRTRKSDNSSTAQKATKRLNNSSKGKPKPRPPSTTSLPTFDSNRVETIQLHSPSSSSTSSGSSLSCTTQNFRRRPPVEDLKPRPFRFDMPEDEIFTADPSSDYLSLVIKQFQRENYCKNEQQ